MENDCEEEITSLQLYVWEVCSVLSKIRGVEYSYDFINNLTTSAFDITGFLGGILEYFAKHAERQVITTDDIKLYFRSYPDLIKLIDKSNEVNNEVEKQSGERKLNRERLRNHNNSVESEGETSDFEIDVKKKKKTVTNAAKAKSGEFGISTHPKEAEVDSASDNRTQDGDASLCTRSRNAVKNLKRKSPISTKLRSKNSRIMETESNESGHPSDIQSSNLRRSGRAKKLRDYNEMDDSD